MQLQPKKTNPKYADGFTLIEVMIAVVIIGIIAMVAIPSYQNQVDRTFRNDAASALLSFASAMERSFSLNSTYCDLGTTTAEVGCGDAREDSGAPTNFATTAPLDGAAVYDLAIQAVTSSTYTITATPIAGERMANDTRCYQFTLTSTGVRGNLDADGNALDNDCW